MVYNSKTPSIIVSSSESDASLIWGYTPGPEKISLFGALARQSLVVPMRLTEPPEPPEPPKITELDPWS